MANNEMNDVRVCKYCGRVIETDDWHNVEGDCICDDCFDRLCNNGDIVICDDCYEPIWVEDEVWVEDDNCGICESCYSSGRYFTCEDCGRVYSYDERNIVDGDTEICDSCLRNGNYYHCYDCDEWFSEGNGDYAGDYWCCDECPRNHRIKEYGYHPEPVFYGGESRIFGDHSDRLYMGIELEVDDGQNPEYTASEIMDNHGEIYCKHDGSLGSYGFEIVSHPCTLEYHMSPGYWDDIIDTCKRNGYTSHDAGSCGLHIHINRNYLGITQAERNYTIGKIVLLTNKFWNELLRFSRRTERQFRWCEKNDLGEVSVVDDLYKVAGKVIEMDYKSGRYRAINLKNYDTVEFRLWRGTLNKTTFYATLQLTSNIVEYAKTHSLRDIEGCVFGDLVGDWEELNEYIQIKGIDLMSRGQKAFMPMSLIPDFEIEIGDLVKVGDEWYTVRDVGDTTVIIDNIGQVLRTRETVLVSCITAIAKQRDCDLVPLLRRFAAE